MLELNIMQIKNFPKYRIDDQGNVYGVRTDILTPKKHNRGYYKVGLWCNIKKRYYEKFIHRLVVENFLGDIPSNLVVNHKNGIKTDNRLLNLELMTNYENRQHAINTGLYKYGDKLSYTRISDNDIITIRNLFKNKEISAKELAKMFNCTQSYVYDIINFKTRKKV